VYPFGYPGQKIVLDEKSHGKSRKLNHINMIVIEDLKSETIDKQAEFHLSKLSVIDSDNSTSYTNIKDTVQTHRPQVIPKEMISKALPSTMPNVCYCIFFMILSLNIFKIILMCSATNLIGGTLEN
jgi:hypothetical protein